MERAQNIPKELISNTLVLDYKTPMSKATPFLKKYPAIVINKDKTYFGVVDSRTIYRAEKSLKLSTNEKIEKFSVKAPKITDTTTIYDLIYYFYRSGVKALPYSNGSKIIGVLERRTFLKVLLSFNTFENMKVNEAMTTPVLAIDAKSSIAQAKATMRERKVNRLIVIQNSKFAGLITNYDIANHFAQNAERRPALKDQAYTPSNIAINSVMETNVNSIEYNRDVSEAVRDMIENKISSLVVMKNKNPIGVITITDVFESLLAKNKTIRDKVFISGFDETTYQYIDDAKEALNSLVNSVEKLSGIEVDYVTFKVKRTRSRIYEMQIRLSLGRHGIVSMHNTKYQFDDALSDLIKKVKHKVIKEKESIVTHKREMMRDAVE